MSDRAIKVVLLEGQFWDLQADVESLHPVSKEQMLARLGTAEARIAELMAALEPFAAISTSSLYADDGSEAERYVVRLYDGTRHEPPHDFTGADLARARQALTPKPDGTDHG